MIGLLLTNIMLGITIEEVIPVEHLESIAALLHDEGEVIQGWMFGVEDAKAEVRRRFPGKPFCLVRQWTIADVDIPAAARKAVEAIGRKTRLVNAHEVVEDSAGRFQPGWWCRSTWELSYGEGFFETGNTVYVLLGEGYRKSTTLNAVDALF